MSDSELNTSSDDALYIGALFGKGTGDKWLPVFMDNAGNTYVFLYKNLVFDSLEEALVGWQFMYMDAFLLGVRFHEIRFMLGSAEVPNVTCEAVSPMTGQKYKVAILSGPAFDEHYVERIAEENDRAEYEARVKNAESR